MTPAQSRRLYFPAWHEAFKANWRKDRGSVIRLERSANPTLASQLEGIGGQWAHAAVRALQERDLRYAVHVVALGSAKDSQDLTNDQLDRVLARFRLLADPDNLAAVVAVDHPEKAARERLEWAVTNLGLPEAYIRQVSRQFGSAEWRDLDDSKLRGLIGKLRARAQSRAPQEKAEDPF